MCSGDADQSEFPAEVTHRAERMKSAKNALSMACVTVT